MNKATFFMAIVAVVLLMLFCASSERGKMDIHTVALKEPDSPFIAFNVWVKCGSQNDPKGKEGLSALTAYLMASGSTTENSFEQILEKLYPMAASYDCSVDKEMTVFSGRVHQDNLDKYYSLFRDALLSPAFKGEDFKRVKNQTMNYLKQTRRFSNDEELSKELLFREIYRGTPYEHPEEGFVKSVDAITLEDVKDFYARYYTCDNVVVGVGGGYPVGYPEKVREDFDTLPPGKVPQIPKPQPADIDGIKILIVEKNTNATPISFGYPISLQRSDSDFFAMMLMNSWMGEHRNSFSNLYQVIREKRGMNYGDYSYIEAYPAGYATQVPPVNVSRRSQIFEVWIRPISMTSEGTLHDRTLFAFRAALRELAKLVEGGMTAEDFDITRRFLKNYTVNFAATVSRRLAYRMDDVFYGIPDPGFISHIKSGLETLSLDQVNAAIKKHLQAKNMYVVFITKDATGMKKKILEGTPTSINYTAQKPKEILEEDEVIASFPIPVKPGDIQIIDINEVFEE